jgi:hypothetical protein
MDQQYDNALHVMEVQGGSFVKSLAACYYAADSTNRPILRQAFASYFDEYERRFAAYATPAPAPTQPQQGTGSLHPTIQTMIADMNGEIEG